SVGARLIPLPLSKLLLGTEKYLAAVSCAEVEELRIEVVSGRRPVVPATQTRADLRSSFRRFHARHHQRTPIRPNARRPIHSGVRRSQEEFSVRAIERVEIAIALGLHNRLPCLP